MIGLFIGSFNPPTLAHLEICLNLSKKYKKIILVPVNSKDKKLIDINDRVKMLSIYQNKYSFIKVDDIMKDYSYLNYRIIDVLKNRYNNVEIIIGSDLLNKLSSFDNYEYLIKNYTFTVITRDGYDDFKTIKDKYYSYRDKFSIISFNSDISSTIAREKLNNKENIENILDQDVFNYIKNHHLY